jgi:hypothetical protein
MNLSLVQLRNLFGMLLFRRVSPGGAILLLPVSTRHALSVRESRGVKKRTPIIPDSPVRQYACHTIFM